MALSLVMAAVLHLLAGAGGQHLPTAQAGPLEDPPPPVDPQIAKELAEKGEATFFVLLDQQADLAPAYAIRDWTERGRYVLETLQRTATSSQAPLLTLLRQRQASHGDVLGFQPLFIVNTVLVTAREGAVPPILNAPGVVRLAANQVLTIPVPQPAASIGPAAVEWGVSKIGADAVWNQLSVRGNGIVVANIDTGVQYDHPALVRQYRGRKPDGTFDHNYNWYDPTDVCGSTPCDNDFHGTHTMGTMVGDDGGSNRIGVAPDATWIAVKGCSPTGYIGSCFFSHVISAGQWLLAPTNLAGLNPDASKRPHIINNSWGGGSGSLFYESIVNAWHAAGIFPAFSAGNRGPNCNTANSPGDYRLSFASGATSSSDAIATFSSRGPAYWGGIKPDVAAPGVGVRSSVPRSIRGVEYEAFNGTSMASPHSAGVVALVWSAGPQLIGRITDTVSLLKSTATGIADSQCSTAGPPNNVYGSGRISATPAVSLARIAGFVTGTVQAADGTPLSGVAVSLSGNSYSPRSTTDGSGRFALTAGAGVYTATATAPYGYQDASTRVTVTAGVTTTLAISLPSSQQSWPVSGFVREARTDRPLTATVHAAGTPLTATTASDGSYSLTPAQGTYVFEVRSPMHRDHSETVAVTAPASRSFSLPPGCGTPDCPRSLPDLATVTSVVTVGTPITIADLTVDLDLVHTWRGDLVLRLTSPRGTAVTLFNRSRGNTGDSRADIRGNFDLSLGVEGPGTLDDFNGERADGAWQLVVRDEAAQDVGSLRSWALHITGTVTLLQPALQLAQSLDPPIPIPGRSVTYFITATNPSTITARSMVIRDTLPAKSTFQSASGASLSGSLLSWPGQDLLPGRSRTYTAVVSVGALGSGEALTNSVVAESGAADGVAAASTSSTLAKTSWRTSFPLGLKGYVGGW